jgi:hypothetical protein
MFQRCVLVLIAVVTFLPVTVSGQSHARSRAIERVHAPSVRSAPLIADGFRRAIVGHNVRGGLRLGYGAAFSQPFGFYSPFLIPTPDPVPVYPVPQPYRPSTYYPTYSDTALMYAKPAPRMTDSQSEVDLAYQVGRLTEQVKQLRREQAQKQPQQTPTDDQPAAETPAIPTTLIFRDGQRREIQNYAVVGQTFWILDETNATAIALSELDIAATRVENERRGIRFLPAR